MRSVEKVEYQFNKSEIIEAVQRMGDIRCEGGWDISVEWMWDEQGEVVGLKIMKTRVKMDAGKEGEDR
jgi:hypothetical protein